MQAVERARIAVHFTLLPGEIATAQYRDQPGPEALRRQVGVDMENLPLTGDVAQEGRDDKLRDALATKASGDEK